MDPENRNLVTPEEQTAEQEALAEAKAEEVRAKIVADLGLTDDENNKPVIDKLVDRELDHRKKLSGAIRQKIDWRTKATATKPPQSLTPPVQQPVDAETIRKQAEDATRATLEQRDLDEMEYPDEIKAEIKKVAQIQGVSVRKAAKDPYITHLVEQAVAAGRIVEAAVPRTQTAVSAPKPPKPGKPEFDMSTPEGRKAYHDSKRAKHGQQ